IGPGDRKSIQPMAEQLALGEYDQLHHFISAGVWDATPVETELLVQADRLVGGSDAGLAPACTRRVYLQSGDRALLSLLPGAVRSRDAVAWRGAGAVARSPRRRYRGRHQRPRRESGQWSRGDAGHLHGNGTRVQPDHLACCPLSRSGDLPLSVHGYGWAGCFHTGPITPTYSEGCRPTLTASLRAPSQPNCRSSCRPSSSSSST